MHRTVAADRFQEHISTDRAIGHEDVSRIPTASGKLNTNDQFHGSRGWWRCTDGWFAKCMERSQLIDVVSRALFPVVFFVFNGVYWTVCIR